MKCVLVTGARGFVGASMIEHILEHTDWIVYFTRRPPKEEDRLARLNLCDRVLPWDEQHIDILLHAAGNASSISCINNPRAAVNDNVLYTLDALEIGRRKKVERFVYISSVEVYGEETPCYETHKCSARNMYAATKYAGEQLCLAFQASYEVPCSIVRLNNTFGSFCQKERFPYMAIEKLLKREKFTLHTRNGEIIGRRWTSIYDVADMVLFILEQPAGGVYNTTHDFMTNLEFLRMIAKALCVSEIDYELVEENIAGRTGNQDAPPDLIRKLGWRPKQTFETRVKEFVHDIVQSIR